MLPTDVMKQVRRLHLQARRAVETLLGGEYRSAFKGAGLSFEEVREYQPGDDVRAIDWNVTARMGHPFLKRYSEEREQTILLLVDLSASLHFGTGATTKRAAAAELAAVLAFAAVTHRDRVGLLGVSDEIECYLPPSTGTRHAQRVLRELLVFEPKRRGTNLSAALDALNSLHRRRAVVFLFSDFLTEGFDEPFRRAAQRHDLIAVRLSDPREQTWPAVGLIRFEDAETGQLQLVDTDRPRFREQFEVQARERAARFTRLARASQVDLLDVSTDGNHFEEMVKFIRHRERRRER